jgi:hypothetical protein
MGLRRRVDRSIFLRGYESAETDEMWEEIDRQAAELRHRGLTPENDDDTGWGIAPVKRGSFWHVFAIHETVEDDEQDQDTGGSMGERLRKFLIGDA